MFQEYVVNGSRYPATISYVVKETDKTTSLVIDVGDVYPVPWNATKLTITLQDAKHTEILKNLAINVPGERTRSTIITEEGTITYGRWDGDDFAWISNADGKDYKPRKVFVANASGADIRVYPQRGDTQSFVRIQHGETSTLVYAGIIITFKDGPVEIFRGTVKPLTSLIVCNENTVKITRKLYGEDIEDKKWIVDGRNYKPSNVNENLQKL